MDGEGRQVPYTEEQLSQFRSQWAQRTAKQRMGFFVFLGLMILWALAWMVAPESMRSLPNGVRMALLLSPALLIILLTRRQAHCPACNVVINTRMSVTFCPSCGVRLK